MRMFCVKRISSFRMICLETVAYSEDLRCKWFVRFPYIKPPGSTIKLMRTSVATLKKSKTLDGPLKKPQKTPGQICTDFAEKSNFSCLEKIELFLKKVAFVETNSDDLFFSHQLWFSNFLPLTDQKLKKQQLVTYFLTKNHLLSSKKHCKICIFRGNLTKPQKNPRFF